MGASKTRSALAAVSAPFVIGLEIDEGFDISGAEWPHLAACELAALRTHAQMPEALC
jgi:hypothetical protein